MASALESKRSRTCCRTSAELVHPIRGSIALGDACSKSSTHDLVWAMERMAFLAGPYMRAVVMLLATLKKPPPVHRFAFTAKMRRMAERGVMYFGMAVTTQKGGTSSATAVASDTATRFGKAG